MAETEFDVAVIGAGMLGAATAYRLARAGARVLVLEAGTAASAATGNSLAWLNAVSKEPESYHRLNAAGMAEYDRLEREFEAEGIGAEARPHRTGCLEWEADAEGMARLEAKVIRLAARGYAARLIDRHELRGLEPHLRPGAAERFAYYARDAWVDAPAVVAALLELARRRGAVVREGCAVRGFERAGARVTAVRTDDAPVAAGATVVCAGIGTEALARQLGCVVAVERRPGLLAITTPVPAGTLQRTVYAPGFHLRPDSTGGLRIGADDTDRRVSAETSPSPPPAAAATLLDRAAALLPLPADVRIARAHIGVRPIPSDGYTVAGRLPGWENAYVAVTHSGITMGPLLGRLLAEEITAGQRDPLLAPFRPERFVPAR